MHEALQQQVVIAHHVAMVGSEDHDRVVGPTLTFAVKARRLSQLVGACWIAVDIRQAIG